MQFRSDMFLLGDLNGGSAIIFAKLVEAALGSSPSFCRFFNISSSSSLWRKCRPEFTSM